MIEPQTIIDDRYEVLSRIGSGGMAEVYLVRDQLLGRQVALKLLHGRFAEDQDFVERFRREASSAAGLSHPNVVGIFDRGEWNGTYYIAMEYQPGRSLKTLVQEQGALDPVAAIEIVIQILRAARFAHRRGIIHRDLTPHNVILDEEGRAKVTDFGIARAGASDMTLTGSIMGTAQYLSPEQAQGLAVSAASDLYAVGIVLYELLTGQVPFDGETAITIALKQVSATPPPPSALNPAVPAALDAVVLRALAKDPAQRFADDEQFIAALQDVRRRLPAVGSEPSAERSEPAPQVSPPPALAPPFPPTGGLAIPAAETSPDGPYGGGTRWWLWAASGLVLLAAVILALLLLAPGKGKVKVPGVTGETQSNAIALLRRAGLAPAPTSAPSATVPAGIVTGESPSRGSLVARGSQVRIVVSTGPASLPLPNVQGLKRAQALERLRAAGFQPAVQAQPNATVARGLVISTDPSAGTEVQGGSPVLVLVSGGPAQVKVPKLVGESQAQAVAALTAAGLSLGTVTPQVSASAEPGTVLSQSPAAATSIRTGQKVNIVVAQASKDAAVPSVVGQSETQASATLGKAGFNPLAHTRTVTSPAQEGVVLAQAPAGGHRVRRGSTVTITVGTLGQPTTSTSTTSTSVSQSSTTTTSTSTTTAPPAANP
jgi:beta-lactam-binding protein with PASTA domain/serine/threonine protein kinase